MAADRTLRIGRARHPGSLRVAMIPSKLEPLLRLAMFGFVGLHLAARQHVPPVLGLAPAVSQAIRCNDAAALKVALERQGAVDAANPAGMTALMLACWFGRPRMVELLVDRCHATVNLANKRGETALMLAVTYGQFEAHHETIRLLLDHGAPVNARSSDGSTALLRAAGCRSRDGTIVKLLLAHGADPNTRSDRGETPLSCAIASHNDVVSAWLAASGAR